MKHTHTSAYIAFITFNVIVSSSGVQAADYELSPDGSGVVRLVPSSMVSADSLNTSLLPSGWTTNTGTGGAISISSYNAGFRESTGGGEIEALFTNGTAPTEGQYLEWVQVLNTNLSLGGNTSPYLDNAANTARPFYSLTADNLTPGLPANQINFYDFSKRDPASLATTDPITWNADLYPVEADASNVLTVYDGVSWGWTMKKAPIGQVTGSFTDSSPSNAVTNGIGTPTFSWGSGDPSSLSFSGAAFNTNPDTVFNLGTLTFRNGVISGGSGADSVTFNALVNFDNIPEKNFTLPSVFTLINTSNTDDPVASADQVLIGDWGYTFNVLEGNTASVNVLAKLTTTLSGTAAGVESGAALSSERGFNPSPDYILTVVGLSDPTSGGFVTATPVPEPSTSYPVVGSGMILLLMRILRHRRGVI